MNDNVFHDLLIYGTLSCVALAVSIMVWFLWKKPVLDGPTKLTLFFGIAVLPITTAMATNLVGFQTTQERSFCGSCHVMELYTEDSANENSTTLASRHARNDLFGDRNCYSCHSDYGIYGTVVTKLTGLNHVLVYYTEAYKWPKDAGDRIQLYHPYSNSHCTHCHSMTTPYFAAVRDHQGAKQELIDGRTTCASGGCHGPSHPFSKRTLTEVKP